MPNGLDVLGCCECWLKAAPPGSKPPSFMLWRLDSAFSICELADTGKIFMLDWN